MDSRIEMFDKIGKSSFFTKIKDLGSITSANFVATTTSSVFWLYMATLIGPETYGLISYFVAIATLGSIIAMLGIGNTIVVYGAKKEKIHASFFTLSILTNVTSALVLYVILNQFEISLFVIGFAIFGLAQADLRSRRNYRRFSIQTVLQRGLMFGLSIGFYHLIGDSGIVLGMALSYMPFAYTLRQGFSESSVSISVIKDKFRFVIHNYIGGLSGGVDRHIDKILIVPILGFVSLGNYYLALQFLLIMGILPRSFNQYLIPEESSGKNHKQLKIFVIFISIGFSLIGIFLAEHLIEYFFPEFIEAKNIIKIVSFAILPMTINQILLAEFLGKEKSKIIMIGGLILVSVHIIGTIVLGTLYKETGIALAYVFAAVAQSIFLLIMKRNSI